MFVFCGQPLNIFKTQKWSAENLSLQIERMSLLSLNKRDIDKDCLLEETLVSLLNLPLGLSVKFLVKFSFIKNPDKSV